MSDKLTDAEVETVCGIAMQILNLLKGRQEQGQQDSTEQKVRKILAQKLIQQPDQQKKEEAQVPVVQCDCFSKLGPILASILGELQRLNQFMT